jgi:hypothetical protein
MSLSEVPDPIWVDLDTGEGRLRDALKRTAAIFDEMELDPTTADLVTAAVALLSCCDRPDPRFRVSGKGRCSKCLLATAMSGSDTCERCSL